MTAGAVSIVTVAPFVGTASAHTMEHADECRGYPAYPGSPNPFVKIVAEDNRFDAECLQAPAGRKFRIYLENRDPDTPHNLSIYSSDPSKDDKAEQLYKGKAVKGPGQEEYALDEMEPGSYFFQDDKTPGMTGTLSIPKPKKK
jgi:hypothetical protein